jgi:hyperosmotically inducible protein
MSRKHWMHSMTAASVAVMMACSGAALAGDDHGKDRAKSADLGTAVSDTAITGKVKAKLGNDTRLNQSDVDVHTANGVVTLTGSAASMKAKRAAGELAKNVDGVVSVENDLVTPAGAELASAEVKTEARLDRAADKADRAGDKAGRVASDSWITTKVKAALLAEYPAESAKISVKTTHKVVHLSGTVESKAVVERAKEITKGIEHVKDVDASGLKVGSG